MRPNLTSVAGAAAVVLLLAACDTPVDEPAPAAVPQPPPAPTAPAPETVTGGTLRFAISEPQTVPLDAVEPDSLIVADALFDSLTAWGPDLVLAPAAARSWETEDGQTWRFHLRPDARFHDGTPVTAADFKFAWDLAARQGTAGFHLRRVEGYTSTAAGLSSGMSGVDAPDDHTLVVRLREPYGQFPVVAGHPALAPLPRAAWQRDPVAFRRQPIGNGPFMAAEALVPGQFLRVQRFDGWRNGPAPAQLDEVLFQFMDAETAFLAFQQGRLQVSRLPEGAVETAQQRYGRADDGYRGTGVIDGVTPTVYFFGFDVTAEPFDEPEVRQAVSLAIDRERIARTVLGGNVEPADALVAAAISGREDACDACVHDPERAADIFAEHGVDAVTLWFNRDGGHRVIAERIRADLVVAGVRRVTFRAPPFEGLVEAIGAGQAELFRFGWQPEYPIADDILYPLFHSEEIPWDDDPASEEATEGQRGAPGTETPTPAATATATPAATATPTPAATATSTPTASQRGGQGRGHNYMRYADPEVDALLADARATTSSMRRMYLHRRAEDLLLQRDQAVVPLFFYRHQLVVADRVVGFALNPMGLVDLHRVLLRPEARSDGDPGLDLTPPARAE